MSLPCAALLVVLLRPADAPPHRQDTQQAEPTDKKKKDKKAKKKDGPEFRFEDHPSLHIAKGTHIDLRARVQGDISHSDAPTDRPADASPLDLAKREVGVAGEIANVIDFQVERALSGNGRWQDVYADYKQFGALRVRGGKFKLPFSLDENTGARNRDFIFRSLAATHLAPGRDRGVMAHGRVAAKILEYEIGVFDHDGRNARTNNAAKVSGGQTMAGRVTVEPLRHVKDAIGDLSVGVAFTRSDVPEGIAGLRGHTVLDQSFFSSADFIVNGRRRRTGVEMRFRPGPASIKAEWMRVETERRGESVEDTDLSPLVGEGWYVSGSYVVTGEKKADGLDKPKKPLFQGGVGAIEVAARVESLRFSSGAAGEPGSRSPRADAILGNRDRVTTVGVNWYVNRWIKIQANIIRETLDDPSQGPLPSQASVTSRVFRLMFLL